MRQLFSSSSPGLTTQKMPGHKKNQVLMHCDKVQIFEKLVQWKESAQISLAVPSTPLYLFSRVYQRFLYFMTVFTLIFFARSDVFHCNSDDDQEREYLDSVCALPAVGLHQSHPGRQIWDAEEAQAHNYYIWTIFFWVGLSVSTFLPLWLFNRCQKVTLKHMAALTQWYHLCDQASRLTDEEREKEIEAKQLNDKKECAKLFFEHLFILRLIGDLLHISAKRRRSFFFHLALAYFLPVVILFLQIVYLLWAFGPELLTVTLPGYLLFFFGLRSSLPPQEVTSSMFPIFASCHYRSHGPSSSIMIRDARCILLLNLYNLYTIHLLLFVQIALIVVLTLVPISNLLYISILPNFRQEVRQWAARMKASYRPELAAQYVGANKNYFGAFVLLHMSGFNNEQIIQTVEDCSQMVNEYLEHNEMPKLSETFEESIDAGLSQHL
ncbi:hypothetical protein TYRP_016042 [Tyrophagus putrescentiae]|nr:hypothetical protein TYRP_016042 [Tyrophagus putrescentiae]